MRKQFILVYILMSLTIFFSGFNCDDDDNNNTNAPGKALVACSDYSSGELSILDLETMVVTNNVVGISSDPVVKVCGTKAYIINRYGFDNIQVLDTNDGYSTILQFSTGNGSNPQDLLCISDNKMYVSRFEPPFNDILVVDPGTGEELGSIDLSSLATNPDNLPRPSRMVKIGKYVYCLLQNIDASFTSYSEGIVAIIDSETDALSLPASISLHLKNPTSMSYDQDSGKLYIGCSGSYTNLLETSGIEIIDTNNNQLVETWKTGAQLGGVPAFDIETTNHGKGYIVLTDPNYTDPDRLVVFNPNTLELVNPQVIKSDNPFEFIQMTVDTETGNLLLLRSNLVKPEIILVKIDDDTIDSSVLTNLPPVSIGIID